MGVSSTIKSFDLIAQMPSSRLHFGESTQHKTIIGGLGTIAAIFLFLALAFIQAVPIYNREKPYIKSQELTADYYDTNGAPLAMKLRDGYLEFF